MNASLTYRNRREAGRALAERLRGFSGPETLVLGLPRGGVPVAAEIAGALGVPLDICIVRKIALPDAPEFAIGAIAAGGWRVLNEELIHNQDINHEEIAVEVARQQQEIARQESLYRAGRPAPELHGRTVIVVDDGLATGFTMRAAVQASRHAGVKRLVVAVPVGAADTCEELAREVDELVCPVRPEPFRAVGLWYEDFSPTTDAEVQDCLARSATMPGASSRATSSTFGEKKTW